MPMNYVLANLQHLSTTKKYIVVNHKNQNEEQLELKRQKEKNRQRDLFVSQINFSLPK